MSRTLEERIEIAIAISRERIADMEKMLHEAIQSEKWLRAAELESYIDGMKQTLIVFEQLG